MPGPRNSPKAFTDWYESDYFRRPRRRWLWTAWIVGAMLVAAAGIAYTFAWPGGQNAYQAGPLSEPHAFLGGNCRACHTETFVTAARFLPGHGDDRSTPDSACLQCHKAGVHTTSQTQFVGPPDADHGQPAAKCAVCHHEHVGGASIAQLQETTCTDCHKDVKTTDDQHRFAPSITRFDKDHPSFGAWRAAADTSGNFRITDGKVGWIDPGTLKFNHKAHMALAANFDAAPDGRNAWMGDAAKRLHNLSCTACHEPDNDRRYIRAVNYDRHCAACHPLTLPGGDFSTRLRHPQRGETTESVRAELLERFWKQIAEQKPNSDVKPASPEAIRPDVLNRPLSAEDRARIQKLARQEEARQFDPAGYPLKTIEGIQWKSGCAYCHEEDTTKPRVDSLPVFKAPGIRDRWKDIKFPHERFGKEGHRTAAEYIARDRWFPYARFSHEVHRMLDCQGCHGDVKNSEKTSDVLMPTIDVCQKCHNHSTPGVRSDCLECHTYHDRGSEPRGLHGRMTVDEVLGLTTATRPGP